MLIELRGLNISKPNLEQIKQEFFAPELVPIVNNPTEIQDLRIIQGAERKDIEEWIDMAVEVLPEISTETQDIKKIMDQNNQKELDHSHTEINITSPLFQSQIVPQNHSKEEVSHHLVSKTNNSMNATLQTENRILEKLPDQNLEISHNSDNNN